MNINTVASNIDISDNKLDGKNHNKNNKNKMKNNKNINKNTNIIQDLSSNSIIDSNNNWIHIDPCEAAVNEPLIYQSWGKNQTYIISYSSTVQKDSFEISDVTYKYTSKFNETVLRRLSDQVNQTFIDSVLLSAKLELEKYVNNE